MEKLLGFHKVNTSAYHPQTDGLVERYNRTLTGMLAKTVEQGARDWDERIPYVLFAYCACQQQSTQESPFYLLYGRDPRLPTEAVLSPAKTQIVMDLKEYGAGLYARMSEAWELARQMVKKAQRRQKRSYDKKSRPPNFVEGDRAFLFKHAEKTGELRKLARPFHGHYRIIRMDVNTAHIRRVDKPQEDTILVALDRLRRCPDEIEGVWPPAKASKKQQRALSSVPPSTSDSLPKNRPTTGGEGSEKIAERTSKTDKVKRDETKKGGKKTEMKTDGSKKNDSTNSGSNENEMKKSEDSEPPMGSGKWSGRLRSSRVTPSARDV